MGGETSKEVVKYKKDGGDRKKKGGGDRGGPSYDAGRAEAEDRRAADKQAVREANRREREKKRESDLAYEIGNYAREKIEKWASGSSSRDR
jgi:hypothetical protein